MHCEEYLSLSYLPVISIVVKANDRARIYGTFITEMYFFIVFKT